MDPASVNAVGLKFHIGSVLIHSRELRPIEDSYPLGLELDYAWHKISQKAWESCMCYPKMGVALTYWDYDNPDVREAMLAVVWPAAMDGDLKAVAAVRRIVDAECRVLGLI